MARMWTMLMLLSGVTALISGRGGETALALLSSGTDAVELLLTLLASMTLWSGLMEILSAAGDAERIGRMFRKVLQPLFPGITDVAAWNAITMNLAANLLGLGNAATPAGIEAAKRLTALGRRGLQALGMLLVMDNAGLQLIPTTVITLRQKAGAADPSDVWGMTLLVSGASAVLAVVMMKLLTRGGNADERLDRRGDDRCGSSDHSAGMDDGK